MSLYSVEYGLHINYIFADTEEEARSYVSKVYAYMDYNKSIARKLVSNNI